METPDFKQLVDGFVQSVKQTLAITLTYDEKGVENLENQVEMMRDVFVQIKDTVSAEELEKQKQAVAIKLGAFVGECVIKEFDGKWEFSEEMGWHIRLNKEDIKINVIGKVLKQLDNGKEDSVLSLYRTIPVIIKDLKEKNEN